MLAVSTADRVRAHLATFVPFYLQHVDFLKLHMLYNVRALPFAQRDKVCMQTTTI